MKKKVSKKSYKHDDVKIRIGDENYKIIFSKDIADGVGLYSYSDKLIKLSVVRKHNYESTLLHEIMHGINDVYNLNLDEHIIHVLATSIADTYERNYAPLRLFEHINAYANRSPRRRANIL